MRILLTIVLPLVAPTALYILYLLAARFLSRQPQEASAVGTGRLRDSARHWPWWWLGGSGVVLMVITLVALAEFGLEPPGGTYVPPQFIDGEIVPGHVVREPEDEGE